MKNKVTESPVTVSQAQWRDCLWLLLVAGTALVVVPGGVSPVQTLGAQSAVGQNQPEPRHDAWQMIPQPLLPPPTDPHEIAILEARGADFDRPSPTHVPLDQPQPPFGRAICWGGPVPEIPFFESEAIVVATFRSHQAYLSPTHLSIYNDVKLSVEKVLEPGPTRVSPGQTIDLLMTGGSVVLPNGRILPSDSPYELSPYVIQPDHRYVFFLRYDSYLEAFTGQEPWELVNGITVPNSPVEVARAEEHRSEYSGLPESIFLEKLRNAIQEHEQH
jgi:hypothetical protein